MWKPKSYAIRFKNKHKRAFNCNVNIDIIFYRPIWWEHEEKEIKCIVRHPNERIINRNKDSYSFDSACCYLSHFYTNEDSIDGRLLDIHKDMVIQRIIELFKLMLTVRLCLCGVDQHQSVNGWKILEISSSFNLRFVSRLTKAPPIQTI